MLFSSRKTQMIDPERALQGRDTAMRIPARHEVLGHELAPPFPAGFERIVVGMGCFWGAERVFWQADGVYTTAVGYAGGHTPNPTYEEVCSGGTGHAEVVQVVYDPAKISYEQLLKAFWENHDPTQGMRQGNDVGSQYRSAVYTTTDDQARIAQATLAAFQPIVTAAGRGQITTEIEPLTKYYFAEDYHQQYLSDQKNPYGYCNHGPNGLSCPIGVARLAD